MTGALRGVSLAIILHITGISINFSHILERGGSIDYGRGMSIIADTKGWMDQFEDSHKKGKTTNNFFNYYIILER